MDGLKEAFEYGGKYVALAYIKQNTVPGDKRDLLHDILVALMRKPLQHHTNFTCIVPDTFTIADFTTIDLKHYKSVKELVVSVQRDRHDIHWVNVSVDEGTTDWFNKMKSCHERDAKLLKLVI